MSERVDELFGSGGTEAKPRLLLVAFLLSTGVVVTGLGLFCSVVPGALVVLLAWLVVERDLDRVDSGFLPVTERPRLVVVRAVVWAVVAGVSALTLLQLAGMWTGVYPSLWSSWIAGWVESAGPVPPPVAPPAPPHP